MAPKTKGGNKKKDENWEDDLGETVDPIAQAAQNSKDEEATQDAAEEDSGMGGGLLAALKKNRGKKQKKGKVLEDFVEGEDPAAEDGVNGDAAPEVDLTAKAPQEATFDDDEDAFGQPGKKGKGGKGGKQQAKAEEKDEDDEEERDASGKIMTKKEKEKAKKEREKARKKEQVDCDIHSSLVSWVC
jgi:translation initiation factor 5B